MTRIAEWIRCAACAALVAAFGLAAHAQEAANETALDVTIRLLPEHAVGPEEITRRIELPPAAAVAGPPDAPTEGPPPGAENGRGQGLDIAAEARERGREFGQEIAEQARENRENAGRPDDRRGPPVEVPSPPNVPSPRDGVPGPPAAPPGRP